MELIVHELALKLTRSRPDSRKHGAAASPLANQTFAASYNRRCCGSPDAAFSHFLPADCPTCLTHPNTPKS
jgi:hypothetical protein